MASSKRPDEGRRLKKNGPRNSANRDRLRLETAAMRLRIVELRKGDDRPSLEEIGRKVGCSIATVHRHLATAIAHLSAKTAEAAIDLRSLDAEGIAEDLERTEYDLGRLDARLQLLDRAQGISGDAPDEKATAEEVMLHSLGLSEGTAKVLTSLIDSKTKLLTKRTELRARRAKMFGVDAPEKIESTVSNTVTTPGEARRVMQELFGQVGPQADAEGPVGSDPNDREPPAGAPPG
jgi:hypothetical protein